MKPQKKPAFSAKPGQSETVQVKDYSEPKITFDFNDGEPRTITWEIDPENIPGMEKPTPGKIEKFTRPQKRKF